MIASGLDVPYPEENRTLAEDISDAGVVLSERPMGAAPQARHFPRRNRIISGLTLGTVVVEAAPKSGSLITARLALEQNREVMAVPGSPLDARHRGTNKLLREGAHLVECAEDVVEIIGPLAEQRRTMEPRRAIRNPRPQARQQRQSETPAKPCHSDASLENRILEVIGAEPLSVDELIRQCQADAAQVQQTLLELELVGTVERQPGNRVARASN